MMNYNLVIHVNRLEAEGLRYALGYVEHSLAEQPDRKCGIVILSNGPAVQFFRRDNSEFAEKIHSILQKKGVSVRLCRHALQTNGIKDSEVADGCSIVPIGIVELVSLQQAGYAYVKP